MAALTRRAKRWSSESGSQLVEFALVAPVLLLVIAGLSDFALLFRSYEVATNAAREGARVAILQGYEANNWQAVRNRVDAYLASGGATGTRVIDVDTVQIDLGGGRSAAGVQVTVDYTYDYLFIGPIMGLIGGTFNDTVTLQSVSAMRQEVPLVVP